MSADIKRETFPFTTGITSNTGGSEQVDNEAHKALIWPVRLRLMACDGITACNISRYEIDISWKTTVVDRAGVIDYIRDAITWAHGRDGLFPMKRSKTPDIVAKEPTQQWVSVSYTTRLFRYFPDVTTGGLNDEAWQVAVKELVDRLTNFDGIADWEIGVDGVSLCFWLKLTDQDLVCQHMQLVLRAHRQTEGSQLFPFAGELPEPTIRFGEQF